MKDRKIIVLMGGPSKEAEVSRRTGAAIAEALESKGYNAQTLELNPRTVLKDIESLGGEIVFNAIHGRYEMCIRDRCTYTRWVRKYFTNSKGYSRKSYYCSLWLWR